MGRFVFFLGLAAIAWFAGLIVFIGRLPAPDGQPPAPADGVVVFTGEPVRVAVAMKLLADNSGRLLLISGVNPATSAETLRSYWQGDPDAFECCVELGRDAKTTVGNAEEVRAWAERNALKSIVLVTSEYHMPRSLAETRRLSPLLEVSPYPVSSGLLTNEGTPASLDAWRKLAGEYSKYLAVRMKMFF